MAEGDNFLYFHIMSMARVLIPKRYCSGDVRVLLFSVGSVGRVKFGARFESGGCGGGSFFFIPLCLCLYFIP